MKDEALHPTLNWDTTRILHPRASQISFVFSLWGLQGPRCSSTIGVLGSQDTHSVTTPKPPCGWMSPRWASAPPPLETTASFAMMCWAECPIEVSSRLILSEEEQLCFETWPGLKDLYCDTNIATFGLPLLSLILPCSGFGTFGGKLSKSALALRRQAKVVLHNLLLFYLMFCTDFLFLDIGHICVCFLSSSSVRNSVLSSTHPNNIYVAI